MKIARIYLRVSTDGQDLLRQEQLVDDAKAQGYYVANVYRDKDSGTKMDRPDLVRLIADLQPGEVLIAEDLDRITRGELAESEQLIKQIRSKGARLAIPGVVDLTEVSVGQDGPAKILMDGMQDMLMRLALYQARNDWEKRRRRAAEGIKLAKAAGKYKGRQADQKLHQRIITLREGGHSIGATAELLGCGTTTVKRVWNQHQQQLGKAAQVEHQEISA